MDKKHEYRVATGSGAGIALLAWFVPSVWPNLPTIISYPALLIGLTLLLWGIWPPIKDKLFFRGKSIQNPPLPLQKPELSLVIGHEGHYIENKSFNIYNVMKTVLVGVKNTGNTHLSNCKLYFELRDPDTNIPQLWLRENTFSLSQGEERYIDVASYNEPLPPHPNGGDWIQLSAPPSGTFWRPPTLPISGGAITLKAISAESQPYEAILKLWVKDNKLHWEQA